MHPTQLRASAEDTATMTTATALLELRYSRLRTPLAILTGDADAVVDGDEQSRRLDEEVAGSTLTVLPGRGHMIHYTAKGQIGRAVDRLMAQTSQRPTRPNKRALAYPALTGGG